MAYAATTKTADRAGARTQYECLRTSLWTERATFESIWRELAESFAPTRARFTITDRNRTDRRTRKIIDSTPVLAVRTLQSGMHAGLTSPARPWLRLTTPDPDLAELGPVKAWLHTATQRMLAVFLQSNLYNALPTLYGDMGVFGTAAMGVLEDDDDVFRCYVYPVGSYAIGLDRRGLASTFVRDYTLSVRQLVDEFGHPDGRKDIDWTKFSGSVKSLHDEGEYEQRVTVCWIVQPNPDRDPDALTGGLPFKSCHFERGCEGESVLRESGFHQFPVMVPRWDAAAEETYGTNCPGMTALGDANGLQIMQRRKAQAVEKLINPPLVGPDSVRTQKVSLLPGDITYDNSPGGRGSGLRPIHEIRPDLQAFVVDIGQTGYRIQRAFYEDLFMMLSNSDGQRGTQPITAREVDERHEEKLLALGPVLERTNDELLDPLVDRVFAMMLRLGLLPVAPPELHGVALKVEYTSLMAQAQKLVGVVAQDRFLQSTLGLAQAFPEVRFKVNVFQAIDDYADTLGVNPNLVHTNDDATAAMQQAQQSAQAQAQAEQLQKVGQGAKALSDTSLEGDSALKRIVEGVSQGA